MEPGKAAPVISQTPSPSMTTSLLKTAKFALLAAITFGLTIKLMQLMDIGCASSLCRSSGYHYGTRLFVAFVCLAVIGALVLRKLAPANNQPPLFASMAMGLVSLMAYVFARSLFNHLVVHIPISRAEVFGLMALALAGSVWRNKEATAAQPAPIPIDVQRLVINLAILYALCVLFADRELPRLMLLSSDPDQHAFFGKQIIRFGTLPYDQGAWGPESFNYPAGSAVILFAMHLLGGLDPRNSLVTLPVLFTFVGALMVMEATASRVHKLFPSLVLRLTAVGLVAGGLMFPLFAQYVHLEGSARQLSVMFVALLIVVLAPNLEDPAAPPWRSLVLPSMIVFALLSLNPANAVMPVILLATLVFRGLLNGRLKPVWVLAMVGGVVLVLLDPYYQRLAGIGHRVAHETLIMDSRFELLKPLDVITRAWQFYLNENGKFFYDLTVLLAEERLALFALLLMVYGAVVLAMHPKPRWTRNDVLTAAAFLVLLYLMYGFTFAFINDRRFFLLGPYFFFNLSQFKAMLLVFLVTFIVKNALNSQAPWWAVLMLAALLVWPAKTLVRSDQNMFLDARRAYCGPLGCFLPDDMRVLKAFQEMTRSGKFPPDSHGNVPKVLIPNAVSRSEVETWLFPISAARVLPQYEVLPAAFYYYQGDADYGTANYDQRVCQSFDRAWLLSKNIRYVYLPSERENACIAGMENLITTEKVVINNGNAYLLELHP